MSWFDRFRQGTGGGAVPPSVQPGSQPAGPTSDPGAAAERLAEWERALAVDGIPSFVEARLKDAAGGRTPWISTTTPAELKIVRDHGIRPIAMVSGTCWYHYGYSWTRGHYEGWQTALARLKSEALAVGANAVVDVTLRTLRLAVGASMDFTVIGTAVRIDGLPPSTDPVVATVPALEFVRLLRAGIVPVGLAVGANYEWLMPASPEYAGYAAYSSALTSSLIRWTTQPVAELGEFWNGVRRKALRELHRDAGRLGDGVLAHTNFGQILREEEGKEPPRFLARFIAIGTVVHTRRSAANVMPDIRPVVDMRDELSPLQAGAAPRHSSYSTGEEEGGI